MYQNPDPNPAFIKDQFEEDMLVKRTKQVDILAKALYDIIGECKASGLYGGFVDSIEKIAEDALIKADGQERGEMNG